MSTPPWTADNGDGTYRNPVLHADWSDPDVVRTGDDYYLTASSFNRVPGLPVLHSTDLVNWRLLGHALDRLTPEGFFTVPRHGCGVWAPAIRHHAGRYWIVYPDPDHGIFVITADDPAGTWTPPRLVLPGRGLIDPCPLWDDDGNAHLVHAWARSRCGFNNKLTAHPMSADLSRPLGEGALVVDGDAIAGCRTLEGPKWYARDGWYWILAPAGGVAQGWQYAFRSRSVLGPYEHRVVLAQGDTPVNGPHQGAWVDTAEGEHWFLHFQDRGAYGRVVHLQPMRWRPDGWPVMGADDGTGLGRPVPAHRKPLVRLPSPVQAPPATDDFADGRPGPQWSWPANPEKDWLPAPGGEPELRIACLPGPADLRDVVTALGQRLPAPRLRATTAVRLDAPAGARAGLLIRGTTYAWAGLERRADGTVLVCRFADRDVIEPLPVPDDARVGLAVVVTDGARARFEADRGDGWRALGETFQATPGGWMGASLCLFATRPDTAGGHARFAPFLVAAPA